MEDKRERENERNESDGPAFLFCFYTRQSPCLMSCFFFFLHLFSLSPFLSLSLSLSHLSCLVLISYLTFFSTNFLFSLLCYVWIKKSKKTPEILFVVVVFVAVAAVVVCVLFGKFLFHFEWWINIQHSTFFLKDTIMNAIKPNFFFFFMFVLFLIFYSHLLIALSTFSINFYLWPNPLLFELIYTCVPLSLYNLAFCIFLLLFFLKQAIITEAFSHSHRHFL